MSYFLGLDSGSTACKGVLMQDGKILKTHIAATGWDPRQSAYTVMEVLLAGLDAPEKDISVAATGYGRNLVDFAAVSITEITCHAMGAEFLFPGVRTIIDVGGQDCKAISVKDGKVLGFQMNDKCAAGTGRFLEMTAARLGVGLSEFQNLLDAGESCTIGSMCAVFAESEMISLLASGQSRESIAGGVVQSIAARAAALAARIQMASPVLITGGLSALEGLRYALAEKLETEVHTLPMAQYAGAIGAAALAKRKVPTKKV